jgi:hypothetical protein
MRLHVTQALQYLEQHGYPMSERQYYRHKKKMQEMKFERMHYIAKYFPDQHLERIDCCELVEKLMWENYHQCKDQVKILESIISIQPYLSGYYEATKDILESTVGRQQQEHHSCDLEEPIVGLDGEPWTLDNESKPTPNKPYVVEDRPEPQSQTFEHGNDKILLSESLPAAITKQQVSDEYTNANDNSSAKINAKTNAIPKDTIDIDVLGCWPKPFDVVPWAQCNYGNTGCNKWFKTQEIRT